MSDYVKKFEDYTASANPSSKREVSKGGNFKLVKLAGRDPNKDSYKLKSKNSDRLLKPDGHLTDEAFTFLKNEMGDKLYNNAKVALKGVKSRTAKDIIEFSVERVDKQKATEDDVKKTTGDDATVKDPSVDNILTVASPIKVGTKVEPVAKAKKEIIDKFKGIASIAKLPEFKNVEEYSDSNMHNVNSGEIIKILKIGFGTPVDKATTDIDNDILALIAKEPATKSSTVSESRIYNYEAFISKVFEAFDTGAVEAYISTKTPAAVTPPVTPHVTQTTGTTKKSTGAIPDKLKGKGAVLAFQKYVINTKKNTGILGKYGADGKWGSNTSKAWDKYGKGYSGKAALSDTKTTLGNKTYSPAQYKLMAEYLDKAMRGLGTNDSMVTAQFKKMKTNTDVIELGKAFGKRDGSNLIEWLAGDGVLELALNVLKSNGVKFNMNKLKGASASIRANVKDYSNAVLSAAKRAADPFGLLF